MNMKRFHLHTLCFGLVLSLAICGAAQAKVAKLGRGKTVTSNIAAQIGGNSSMQSSPRTCSAGCSECDKSKGVCNACQSGYMLYDGVCIKCPEINNGSCRYCTGDANYQSCESADCNTGYWDDTGTCASCGYAIEGCLECDTYAHKCTKCDKDYLRQKYECKNCPENGICNGTDSLKCKEGSYFSSAGSNCPSCSEGCAACTSANNCTQCKNGYSLKIGACIANCASTSDCPAGYICNGSKICEICGSGSNLGIGGCNCPTGKYSDGKGTCNGSALSSGGSYLCKSYRDCSEGYECTGGNGCRKCKAGSNQAYDNCNCPPGTLSDGYGGCKKQ